MVVDLKQCICRKNTDNECQIVAASFVTDPIKKGARRLPFFNYAARCREAATCLADEGFFHDIVAWRIVAAFLETEVVEQLAGVA